MRKKIVWLLVSCLMVAALVLASCAAAVTEEEEEVTPPAEEEEEAAGPKYGGTITMVRNNDPLDYDEAYQNTWNTWTLSLTHDNLVNLDWSKGPSGTNEFPDLMNSNLWNSLTDGLKGHLAESWEYPDPTTLVFHIRQGVHWIDKSPANGRELTSEDVAASLKRMFEMPASWLYGYPYKIKSYETPDKYTLVTKADEFDAYRIMVLGSITYIQLKELIFDEAGNETEAARDWENQLGTGPYMLVDFVPGNALYFDRNPDYWEMDPFIPENQLPYADHFKILVIPERSTQLAALRAGKIDQLNYIEWEEKEDLTRTSPELEYRTMKGVYTGYAFRTDIEPYSDINVRQALSMAINRDMIIDDFFHGDAVKLASVIAPETVSQYTPWEELPDNVKRVLEYRPDEARQLLADAGYPNGFKMIIDTNSTYADLTSLVASMWEDVGIDVEIKVREPAVFQSLYYGKSYENVMTASPGGNYGEDHIAMLYVSDVTHNVQKASDLWLDEQTATAMATVDDDERNKLFKELNLYVLEKVWKLVLPRGDRWVFWQPWLKRYTGEVSLGYCQWFKQYSYAWVDQDLKESMTGVRD